MSEIVLSVVVATYNRLPELQTMLDSLLPQVRGKPVEILIADDRSTDSTWEWLQTRFAGVSEVHLLRMDANGGPGPARNLCLAVAAGQYFVPIDSDFIVMEGAIDKVLEAIRENESYRLLFFSCLQYPALQRLDKIGGRREIDYEAFLAGEVGELSPVASLAWLRERKLGFPCLRAGGESLLWADMLHASPGLFMDVPIILYRTDVSQRICTLEYQLEHPADLAAVSDAMVSLYDRNPSAALRAVHARKCLAAGAYHLLAGNTRTGRQRLLSAVSLGSRPAIAALAASLAGKDVFRRLFQVYRTRVAKAYL